MERKPAVYHPTTRVLAVLDLLQARRAMSGPELARRLDVTVRTVRRYVLMLQDLGIPIEAERGRYGRYRLPEGYMSRLPVPERDADVALNLGMVAARRHRLGLAAYPEAGSRLPSTLLPATQADAAHTLVLDVFGAREARTAVLVGTFEQHGGTSWPRIQFRYRSYDWPRDGALPLALFLDHGAWYMVGHLPEEPDLHVASLRAMVYADLYAEALSDRTMRQMLALLQRLTTTVTATWPVQVLLQTTLDDARARVPASPATLHEADGGVLLRCSTDDLAWMALFLNGLGCAVQVREPEPLRRAWHELNAQPHRSLAPMQARAAEPARRQIAERARR